MGGTHTLTPGRGRGAGRTPPAPWWSTWCWWSSESYSLHALQVHTRAPLSALALQQTPRRRTRTHNSQHALRPLAAPQPRDVRCLSPLSPIRHARRPPLCSSQRAPLENLPPSRLVDLMQSHSTPFESISSTSPSRWRALPRAPSSSLELPRAPSSSLALPRAHSRSGTSSSTTVKLQSVVKSTPITDVESTCTRKAYVPGVGGDINGISAVSTVCVRSFTARG